MTEKISVEAFCRRYDLPREIREYCLQYRSMRAVWYRAHDFVLVEHVALHPGVISDWAFYRFRQLHLRNPLLASVAMWPDDCAGLPRQLEQCQRWHMQRYLGLTRLSGPKLAAAANWLRRNARPDFSLESHTGKYLRYAYRLVSAYDRQTLFHLESYGDARFEVTEDELADMLPLFDSEEAKTLERSMGKQYVSMSSESPPEI